MQEFNFDAFESYAKIVVLVLVVQVIMQLTK